MFFGIDDIVLASYTVDLFCNNGSTIYDRYLIISLRDIKDNGATCLCKMFSEKRRNISGLKSLIKRLITLALSINY